MNNTQNQKIAQVTDKTLIVGVDIGGEKHFARAILARGFEVSKKPFPFMSTEDGFDSFVSWAYNLANSHKLTKIMIAMEPTGHYWFTFAAFLKRYDVHVVLVAPQHVKHSKEMDDNTQEKDDRKDPIVIARLVPEGRYLIQQAVQPFAAVSGGPLEVILAHTEEGQSLAAAIEGFCSGFLPGLGGLRHAFQRFTGGFRSGRDVYQLYRAVHQCGGKSDHTRAPYSMRVERKLLDEPKLYGIVFGTVRELPRFAGLARTVLGQAEELISLVPALQTAFSVDTAEGVQLDLVGETLGVSRSAAADSSDETYRAFLKAKLALWRWDGTNESVPALLAEAFPGQGVTLKDNGNMTVTVENADSESILPIPAGAALV